MIFGGTNDFGHGDAPIGTPDDRIEDSFWGACHLLCTKLIRRFPKSQIVYMGSLHRITEEEPNRHGKISSGYVEIIKIVTR